MEIKNEEIGNKFKDFELLQLLGEGSSGKVIKVRSLLNKEIYAMKIINLELCDKEYIQSEIEMLKKINHENIVKYYSNFQEDNKIYIIMEYLEYGELKEYINLLKYLNEINRKPKKFEIINIFIQCIRVLKYLKDINIIHRDIKPENIFISKKCGIKLGDLGVAALMKDTTDIKDSNYLKKNNNTIIGSKKYMAPEVKKGKKYNEKADIYSMGLIFHQIYFQKEYREEIWKIQNDIIDSTFIRKPKPDKNEDPLVEFIFSMLEEDFTKRPDIDYLYNSINKIYIENFSQEKNSSIYSVLRCLGNFTYIKDYFQKKYKIKDNKKYSEWFYNFIIDSNRLKEAAVFFRQKYLENNDINFLDINKEIKPNIILNFILDKIHIELLDKEKNIEFKNNLSKNEFDEKINKKRNEQFEQNFSSNFNSKIANNFSCIMKTYYHYLNCKNTTFNYSTFFSLSFDLKYFLSKNDNVNLKDLFKYQNDITLKYEYFCSKCKKIETRLEKNMFYYLPFCLVINLNYEDVNNNFKNIIYPKQLDFSEIKGMSKSSAKKFNLVGIIKNLNEHYISIIFDYINEKKWIIFDSNKKIDVLNHYNEHKNGRVEMLFYFSQDK